MRDRILNDLECIIILDHAEIMIIKKAKLKVCLSTFYNSHPSQGCNDP